MTYIFQPGPNWRYVLKREMLGTDVAALQLNLPNVDVDGNFGASTEQAVTLFQQLRNITADGIAGGETQRQLCLVHSYSASENYGLPRGLLSSMMANESGYYIAAYSPHPSDWGWDMGPYQSSIGPSGLDATQENYRSSYDISYMANDTAAKVAKQQQRYRDAAMSRYLTDLANGDKWKFSWQLAVNYHNWPFASENIWRYGHIYPSDPARDDLYQSWIATASGGQLTTPRQWVYAYITKATVYVRWLHE